MQKRYKSLSEKEGEKIVAYRQNLSLENIDGEIWKDIPGYEGLYQASSLGRIKALAKTIKSRYDIAKEKYSIATRKEIIKKQKIDRDGYAVTNLSDKTDDENTVKRKKHKTIHRLVITAFIPNYKNLPCINHKNGIKTDNRIKNLEWVSMLENNIHAIKVLHRRASRYWTGKTGKDNAASKPIFQYDLNGNFIQQFDSLTIAATAVGAASSGISSYLYRQKNSKDSSRVYQAYGYRWALK